MEKNRTTRLRLEITGRVQGVGFRSMVADKAENLGLSGWVRNEYDGTVLIEAEGPTEAVEELRSWCQQSPGWSHVAEVHTQSLPVKQEHGFHITRAGSTNRR